MRVDTVQGQPLHIRSTLSVSLSLTLPIALCSVCNIWKNVCAATVQTVDSQPAFLCFTKSVDSKRKSEEDTYSLLSYFACSLQWPPHPGGHNIQSL